MIRGSCFGGHLRSRRGSFLPLWSGLRRLYSCRFRATKKSPAPVCVGVPRGGAGSRDGDFDVALAWGAIAQKKNTDRSKSSVHCFGHCRLNPQIPKGPCAGNELSGPSNGPPSPFRYSIVNWTRLIQCVANAADRAEGGSYDMAGTPKAKAIAKERAKRLYALASRLEKCKRSPRLVAHLLVKLSQYGSYWSTL